MSASWVQGVQKARESSSRSTWPPQPEGCHREPKRHAAEALLSACSLGGGLLAFVGPDQLLLLLGTQQRLRHAM